jgi:hypothetical protein
VLRSASRVYQNIKIITAFSRGRLFDELILFLPAKEDYSEIKTNNERGSEKTVEVLKKSVFYFKNHRFSQQFTET